MIGFCALNWRKFKKVFKFQVIWVKQAIFNLIFNGFYVIRFQVTPRCLRSYNIKQGSLHWNSFVRETYWSIYSYQKIRKVESSRRLLKKNCKTKEDFHPSSAYRGISFEAIADFFSNSDISQPRIHFSFVSFLISGFCISLNATRCISIRQLCWNFVLMPFYPGTGWLNPSVHSDSSIGKVGFFYRNITDFLCCLRHLQASFTDRQRIMGKF